MFPSVSLTMTLGMASLKLLSGLPPVKEEQLLDESYLISDMISPRYEFAKASESYSTCRD